MDVYLYMDLKFKEKSRGREGVFSWQGTKEKVSFALSEERLGELIGCQAEIDEFINVRVEKASLSFLNFSGQEAPHNVLFMSIIYDCFFKNVKEILKQSMF